MKREFIIFLAVCTFAAAMVPRDRRAVNTEEDEEMLRLQTTTNKAEENICHPDTPCAWSLYKSPKKFVEMNITNRYCKCSEDTVCKITEEDYSSNSFVLKCRAPETTTPEETTSDS